MPAALEAREALDGMARSAMLEGAEDAFASCLLLSLFLSSAPPTLLPSPCEYVCMYTYMYVCIHMYVRTYVCIEIRMYVCIYIYVCMYVRTYVCIYVDMYVCI